MQYVPTQFEQRHSCASGLCSLGRLFADALRRAIVLGSSVDCFPVVTLESNDDRLVWIQFSDQCVNVTDALPRASNKRIETEPVLHLVSQSPGLYSTFTFDSPPRVREIAAMSCHYMRASFSYRLDDVTWEIEEFASLFGSNDR